MVVKEDMDICLNIVGGTAKPKKQSSQILTDMHIKRLKKKSSEKIKKPFQKFHSTESEKSLVVGAKKRIKQKSLANIVAKNIQQANISQAVPKASILKKSISNITKKSLNLLTCTGTKDSEPSKQKKVSFQPKTNTESSETITFVKPTKESTGKTILAKKRKVDTNGPKKSLSNIFKTSDSTETKLLKSNVDKDKTDDNFISKEHRTELTETKSKTNYSSVNEDNNFKNIKKSRDKFEGKKNPKFEDTRPYSKPSGKISSLFAHNPEIPNIGQRFVKPVNEKVFTIEKFSELDIHDYAVSNLEQNLNITNMTTVQKKSIPVILSGNDVLVRSQTGSGKTLAYALPIIENLQNIRPKLSRDSGIKALVIVPTRELALQTYECFLKLIKPFTWIVPGYLVGGEKRKAEKARLRKGCIVLVATPGRLLDHIKHTKALKLDSIKYLVLDEADRMLDIGYEKDISEIVATLENVSSNSGYDALQMLRRHINPNATNVDDDQNENDDKHVKSEDDVDSNDEKIKIAKQKYHSDSEEEPDGILNEENSKSIKRSNVQEEKPGKEVDSNSNKQKRQTILLSATLTHAVEKLAGLTMQNPVFVDAANENIETAGGSIEDINEDLVVPQTVVQSYVITPPKLRMVTLSAYIAGKCQSQGNHKILVFMATQDMVDYHSEILAEVLNKPVDEEDEDSDPLVDVEFFKLHGNMQHKERTEVFKTFKQAKSGVLLCTDVAARGLDLPKVDTVVQYTGPTSARDYVHRIGRTARTGSSGAAVTFLTPPEVQFVRMLEARRIRIKQDDMDDILGKLMGPLSKHRTSHGAAIDLQNEFETAVIENKKFYAMACKAYTSWVRFYSSYPREMREAFNRKDLHLGHYAKSFALRDPPQKIGGAGRAIRERQQAQQTRPKHQNRLSNQRPDRVPEGKKSGESMRQQDRKRNLLRNVRMLNTSEYDSGLEPIKKPKKS